MAVQLSARSRTSSNRHHEPDRTGISPDSSCRGHVCCGSTAHATSVCCPRSRCRRHRRRVGGSMTSPYDKADMGAVAIILAAQLLEERRSVANEPERPWEPEEERGAISGSRWEPVNLDPVLRGEQV